MLIRKEIEKNIFSPKKIENPMLIHAVAMKTTFGVVLLLGHSKAGKTTLSRSLKSRWKVLADDIVFIARNGENMLWYVADAKKQIAGSYILHPLFTVIRVFQSQEAKLVQISEIETCQYLLDGLFEVSIMRDASQEKKRLWFKHVSSIAKGYRGWKLNATLGEETPNLVFNKFNYDV